MVKTIISFLLVTLASINVHAYGCSEGWVESGTYLETSYLTTRGNWSLTFVPDGAGNAKGRLVLESTGPEKIQLSATVDTDKTPLFEIEQKVSEFKQKILVVIWETHSYLEDPGCDILNTKFKIERKHVLHLRLSHGKAVDFEGLHETEMSGGLQRAGG